MGGCKREMPPGFAEDARNGMIVMELTKKYHVSTRKVCLWLAKLGIKRVSGKKRSVAQYDIDTGGLIATYPSMIAAGMEMYGDCYSNAGGISDCCRGKRKTACGYAWRYWEEEKHGQT